MPVPILVTGGSGQVGTAIARENGGRFDIVAPSRAELDLGDAGAIGAMIGARDWAAVINCAAYTAVDRAESEREAAFAVNAEAPGAIALAAAARGIPLLHVSTDYVFDGSKAEPYREDDPVRPLGVYGASKEAGEQAVRVGHPRHIILRTAWVVSPWGGNFVKTMLRLGGERPELRVVDDQIGCPTGATDIARALLAMAERLIADPDAPLGTYHFVNAGEASWHQLALAIFAQVAAEGGVAPAVLPIPTSEYPTPAKRPMNSRLATDKIARDYGIVARDWRAMIAEVVRELRGAA